MPAPSTLARCSIRLSVPLSEVARFHGCVCAATAIAAASLPADGRLLACDISDDYTRVGRQFWQQAGVAHKIELKLAPAIETL